jgi:large subunit ribosomal protein L10
VREIEALADVPPRAELLGRLANGFQAPLVQAAGLFQAFTRNFAYGLKAYVDQRVEAGEALPAEAEPQPPATETETNETENDSESDAERAPADGGPPAAASDAKEEEE